MNVMFRFVWRNAKIPQHHKTFKVNPQFKRWLSQGPQLSSAHNITSLTATRAKVYLTPKFKFLLNSSRKLWSDAPGPPPRFYFGPIEILIGINTLVFLLWYYNGSTPQGMAFMRDNFLFSINNLEQGRLHTLVTSFFSQARPDHFLLNMIALHVFGPPVLNALGTARFVAVYMAAGVCSNLAQMLYSVLTSSHSGPYDLHVRYQSSLGASGCVNAISMIFACLYPRSRLLVMLVLPMPAFAVVAAFLAYDIYSASTSFDSRVGHASHIGGAAFGAFYYLAFLRRMLRR